jgi:sec-independent protein translocase protein TatA
MMGGMSLWHWVVVGIVLLLLFGRGKFSGMMGDVAKGIKEFKKGMAEEDNLANTPPPAAPAPRIDATQQGGQVIDGEATRSSETKL